MRCSVGRHRGMLPVCLPSVRVRLRFKYIFNNFAFIYIPALKFGGDQWKILISKIVSTLAFALLAKNIFKKQHKTVEELAEEEYIK
ncbi:MAG: hypothetical protein II630_04490, partial [Bacteroidales bacterium]|nr:hypothetical protein [Bacteroidales bacterium]